MYNDHMQKRRRRLIVKGKGRLIKRQIPPWAQEVYLEESSFGPQELQTE